MLEQKIFNKNNHTEWFENPWKSSDGLEAVRRKCIHKYPDIKQMKKNQMFSWTSFERIYKTHLVTPEQLLDMHRIFMSQTNS